MNIRRLLCKIRLHKWKYSSYFDKNNIEVKDRFCQECNNEEELISCGCGSETYWTKKMTYKERKTYYSWKNNNGCIN